MRLLAWNLNHRAARRSIPGWIAESIAVQAPDVLVLTEYVEGNDHGSFCRALCETGLRHITYTPRVSHENQTLIATRQPHHPGHLSPPAICRSLPQNFLHIQLSLEQVHVVGFRMPAYVSSARLLKRQTWEWLLGATSPLLALPALIAGDFNTAFDDPKGACGNCLNAMVEMGWRRADPGPDAISFYSRIGRGRLIHHAFLSPKLHSVAAETSWHFRDHSPDAAATRVGRPDHAMLLVEVRDCPSPGRD